MSDVDDPDDGTNDELSSDRKRSRKLPAFAVLMTLAAGGAGYLAVREKLAHDETRDELSELATKNTALADALDLHRNSAEELDTKLTDCQEGQITDKSTLAEQGAALAACQEQVSDLAVQSADTKKRLAEFNQITSEFRKMIDSGKLDVAFRRGRMVVKLPAAVLFASGEAELSENGSATLKEVGAVLRKMRKRRFIVAGHTDSVPVGKDAPYHSNWGLSTARAVTVTEQLIRDGVRAKSLMAAGLGANDPIASNRTKRGRLRNRRIEIILEPNMAPAVAIERLADEGNKRKPPKRRKR